MNIAVATNISFLRYTYVMLTSLFENNRDSAINVYLLYRDIPDEHFSDFRDLSQKYKQKIHFTPVNETVFPGGLPQSDKWPVEIYFRLALPFILPKEISRILYLDADIIVCRSIKELYNSDFSGHSFCACEDTSSGKLSETQNTLFSEICQGDFTYHNSGVLLMNLDKIRENYSLSFFLDKIAEKKDLLTAFDQDLINYIFFGDFITLDRELYNLPARIYFNSGIGYDEVRKANTSIVHFTGPKPWSGKNLRTNIERIWWDYARLTPYYHSFLEDLLMEEIDLSYTNSSEYSRLNAQCEDLRVQNAELSDIVEQSRLLLEKLAQGGTLS